MENELKDILHNYIDQVTRLCRNLLEGLELRNKEELIKYLYMGKERVWELKINNVLYKFHGGGCNAYYGINRIQWDFGRRSHWCCIDPWFVSQFIKDNQNNFLVSLEGDYIKLQCEKAVKEKEMYLENGRYYFTIPLKDTFRPQFPSDFDMVVVKYYDDIWKVPKNKELIRFIKKSTFVFNLVDDISDKYILEFQKDNETIYTIAYSDICYPEKAVVIMSDRIIRNLKKGVPFSL